MEKHEIANALYKYKDNNIVGVIERNNKIFVVEKYEDKTIHIELNGSSLELMTIITGFKMSIIESSGVWYTYIDETTWYGKNMRDTVYECVEKYVKR